MDKTDRLRDYGLAFLLYEQGLGVCGYELIRELFIFVKLILNSYLYTALPAVITTQYILEGKTKIGLNCLCDSLNCQSFMSDLDFYGIKYSYYEHKN